MSIEKGRRLHLPQDSCPRSRCMSAMVEEDANLHGLLSSHGREAKVVDESVTRLSHRMGHWSNKYI